MSSLTRRLTSLNKPNRFLVPRIKERGSIKVQLIKPKKTDEEIEVKSEQSRAEEIALQNLIVSKLQDILATDSKANELLTALSEKKQEDIEISLELV